MTTEQNKTVVRRALDEVWSRGKLDVADELYAADFVSHQHSHPEGAREARGVAALKAFAAEFRTAFPDFLDTVDDQVAEGDMVVTRFTSAGTQDGPLMGISPTHRHVSWMGITIDRVVAGRIVENWVSWDMLSLLQQLGVKTLPA